MSIIKWIFNRVSRTSAWVWFSRRILSKWTLRMMGYPKTALPKFSEIAGIMSSRQPLDVFAFTSCDRKTPIAMIIKLITGDRFSHAGFVTSALNVYDSRSEGVAFRSLLEMIGQSDDFAIIKYTFKSKEHKRDFDRDMQRFLGYPYDFTQELGGNSLYCSEVVYSFLRGRVEQDIEARYFHGQRGFSPGDVYNSGQVVFDHNPTY